MSEDKKAGPTGPIYVVNYSYIDDHQHIKTGRLGIQAETEAEARHLALESVRKTKKAALITRVRLY